MRNEKRIAVEHFDGRFPFWLSPHQSLLTPLKPLGADHDAQLARCLELEALF
jgi:threonyl-tRNA synthetase